MYECNDCGLVYDSHEEMWVHQNTPGHQGYHEVGEEQE